MYISNIKKYKEDKYFNKKLKQTTKKNNKNKT